MTFWTSCGEAIITMCDQRFDTLFVGLSQVLGGNSKRFASPCNGSGDVFVSAAKVLAGQRIATEIVGCAQDDNCSRNDSYGNGCYGLAARKLRPCYPFYALVAPVSSHSPLLGVWEEAVLLIFWILTIVRPMSDDGGDGFSRIPILSFPPNLTRANKELSDMKRAMFSVLTLVVLGVLVGCAHHGRHSAACAPGQSVCEGEAPCDGAVPATRHCCRLCGGRGCKECCQQPAAEAGPPAGAITYPYYTTRGPRDFYAKNPGSIGP
jgi:hypothetical protein